ncbi:MAG: AraC family transcriptional regulator ligand-binding domain-containing protein [Proteobacteria bacterium]|nr:AraC family transcriptional regulator ligand-binding domain-containing protein [Pseudomonadota bacterium]
MLLGQQRNRLASVGPVGFLVQNSPTLDDALHNLIRYVHLHGEGISSTLQVRRGEALFTVSIDLTGIVGVEQVLDTATADIFMLIRMIAGREWLPSAVHFAHRPPPNPAPYRTLVRAPVHFDREITCLRFPAHWLERPVPNADPDLCSLIQSYVTQIEQQYTGDFSGKIRHVVRTMLPTNKCTAVRIAELFSVSLRTLQRHITANGTSFEAIVDETRHEIATHILAETNKPIGQLAAMLGYRDSRAFTRAFRRWSGSVPSEWREHQRKIPA